MCVVWAPTCLVVADDGSRGQENDYGSEYMRSHIDIATRTTKQTLSIKIPLS